ncbi:MAG: alpha/beta hydrolase [Sulfuritalea sp.]|nr:alpha/beta hydrolase [Sulfuritalea sp.]
MLAFSGCTTLESIGGSRRAVVEWSQPRGFADTLLAAGGFQLLALIRGGRSDKVSIYIEGDGAAWPSAFSPPADPTPQKPVALALAAADHSGTVVYLGRPCQYLDKTALRDCNSAYWTGRRFAPEVLAAYDGALNQIKNSTGAHSIELFGYSGGGVLATLLAAQRKDVELMVTVASPLALEEWTAWHDVSPLGASLDPAKLSENVRLPRSVHFVGTDDRIVPPAIVENFIRRKGGRIERVPGFDHECCWARDWVTLLRRAKELKEEK